ncbi:MAG: hypothetical protein R3182_09315, partial [Draconibacterium sp.]|nr:hypothetical protein [Draconibacterium sp.]
MKLITKIFLISIILIGLSCSTNQKKQSENTTKPLEKGTYGYDLQFLKEHKKPVELQNGDARIVICPEYQ